MKCVLCNRDLKPDETMTCRRCVQRLDETLEAIVEMYALLPSVLLPGSVPPDGMPHGRQAFPPAPIRLEVLDALDERWMGDEQRGVLGVVGSWARLVREERQLTALSDLSDATVVGEVGLLRKHLSWVCEQPWVDEMQREIKAVHRDLRLAAGESGPKPIGACPAERIENGQVVTCGAWLYVPTVGDAVQCRRCKTVWPRERWLILGKILGEGEAS